MLVPQAGGSQSIGLAVGRRQGEMCVGVGDASDMHGHTESNRCVSILRPIWEVRSECRGKG